MVGIDDSCINSVDDVILCGCVGFSAAGVGAGRSVRLPQAAVQIKF